MLRIEELPRTALTQGIRLTRLPLTTFEAVARRGKDEPDWGPAVLFERAEAAVKERVGSLVGDERLVAEAGIQRAKLAKLDEAARTEAEAEAAAARADAELRRRQGTAQDRKQQAKREAAQRKAELARRKAAATQQVEERFEAREAAVQQVEERTERQLDRQQTAAERRRLAAEAVVLQEQERAAAAKGQAVALDRAVQRTKQARKARR